MNLSVALDDRPLGADPRCFAGATPPLWGIILAGGEGMRLRSLVRYLCGEDRPKQYVRVLGDRSLLRQTLDRMGLVIPPERTVVVVHRNHASFIQEELRGGCIPRLLVQSQNRGTAAAVLLAAHWISWRNPEALVTVAPSDHFVQGEVSFMTRVAETAAFVARQNAARLVLLGAVPTEPDPQYGWIETGDPVGRIGADQILGVRGFLEKPRQEVADAAWVRGDLWNTAVLVSAVESLLEVGSAMLPETSDRIAAIEPYADTEGEEGAIASAYASMPRADFSRAILEHIPSSLAAVPLPRGVSWSDWGTPERVIRSLSTAGITPAWLRRLTECAPTLQTAEAAGSATAFLGRRTPRDAWMRLPGAAPAGSPSEVPERARAAPNPL